VQNLLDYKKEFVRLTDVDSPLLQALYLRSDVLSSVQKLLDYKKEFGRLTDVDSPLLHGLYLRSDVLSSVQNLPGKTHFKNERLWEADRY